MSHRVEALDWLRGIMAVSIMIYHLFGWIFFDMDASFLLGRLGIYGVSVFFILSGLSMALVYSNYIKDFQTSWFFIIRRVFRIWPLLWICIALVVITMIIRGQPPSIFLVIANMTTIFGFIKPYAYINTGAWSIGNEMVYYAMTPFIIFLYNKNKFYGDIFTVFSFSIFCIFAFFLLRDSATLASQWRTYINPFNNLFLYVVGVAIFYHFKDVMLNQAINLLLFISALFFFLFYPVSGDQILLVTGLNRVFFVLFSIVLVVSFYKFNLYSFVPRYFGVPLEQFGLATYGVYLLHPVIWLYLTALNPSLVLSNNYSLLLFICITTIIISIFSFNIYEKKLIKLGKNLTKNSVVSSNVCMVAYFKRLW